MKNVKSLSPVRLKVLLQTETPVILDVRELSEYQDEHLPTSIHIPLGELEPRLDELKPYQTQTIIVHCKSGKRSAMACKLLMDKGFTVVNLSGGMLAMSERQPKPESLAKMKKFAEHYWTKSGTSPHPDPFVSEAILKGLALHLDELGKPLCPCNIYEDKHAEIGQRRWICACEQMKTYKYCQCLLFVTPEGLPITEYLPEGHDGRKLYGLVKDTSLQSAISGSSKKEAIQ
jgi:ferredoxin-thioredoxin reductase catalytic chain